MKVNVEEKREHAAHAPSHYNSRLCRFSDALELLSCSPRALANEPLSTPFCPLVGLLS